jgi:hypothetical protein
VTASVDKPRFFFVQTSMFYLLCRSLYLVFSCFIGQPAVFLYVTEITVKMIFFLLLIVLLHLSVLFSFSYVGSGENGVVINEVYNFPIYFPRAVICVLKQSYVFL